MTFNYIDFLWQQKCIKMPLGTLQRKHQVKSFLLKETHKKHKCGEGLRLLNLNSSNMFQSYLNSQFLVKSHHTKKKLTVWLRVETYEPHHETPSKQSHHMA